MTEQERLSIRWPRTRNMWTRRTLDHFARNALYVFRMLKKNPGFAITAILTMGLGIGASVVMFSVLNTVLLRPLPFCDPGRLAFLWEKKQQFPGERMTVAPANYRDWKEANHVFEDMTLVKGARFNLGGVEEPARIQGLAVSANFFQLLGTKPQLGRTFLQAEEKEGANHVVVLSDSFWREHLHGDPQAAGKTLTLNDELYTIVGVLRPDFYFPEFDLKWELWTPLVLTPAESNSRDAHSAGSVGRLRPGVSLAEAQREMNAIARRLEREFPATNGGSGVTLIPIQEQANAAVRQSLVTMVGAVSLFLLIACSNVAILLLVRSTTRRKEMAVRIAVGARTANIIVQLLTESVVLALMGGLAGMLAATAVFPLLRAMPVHFPRMDQITVDWRVLAFSFCATILSGVFFGLTPAIQMVRKDAAGSFKGSGRSSTHDRNVRLALSAFVVAEITLAFVLLVGAGLLVQSLARVLGVNAGFRADQVLTATVSLPQTQYAKPRAALAFQKRLLDRVRRLPGARASALTTNLPIGGAGWSIYFSIEGRQVQPGVVLGAAQRLVSDEYFQTMEIPLLSGRVFDADDAAERPLTAVVNEAFEKKYFPGQSAIGNRVRWGGPDDHEYPWWFTIVGVVGNVHDRALESPPSPELYMCSAQMSGNLSLFAGGDFSLVVRYQGNGDSLIHAIRNNVREMDGSVLLTNMRTMDEVLSRSLTPRKFYLTLLGVFAALALLLAWIGVYGLIAYSTSLRTREIGIRMALGSNKRSIFRLIASDGLRLTLTGIGLGLTCSWVLTRLMTPMLYEVGPHAPTVLSAATMGIAGAALFATYIPAYRAAKIEVTSALRTDGL